MKGARPLAAPAVAFGLGIALGAWLPFFSPRWSAAAALLSAAAAVPTRKRRPVAAAWPAVFLFLGLFRFQSAVATGDPAAALAPARDATVAGVVSGPPERRDDVLLIDLAATRIRTGGVTRKWQGMIRVSLQGEGERPEAGETLLARGSLVPPARERNFSWFSSLPTRAPGPSAPRLFVPSPVWIRRGPADAGVGLRASVMRLRQRAVDFWDRRGGEEAAVLKALTTGQRGSIPDDVRESFRRSGVAHLLAVSGLHLGFAALFLYAFWRQTLVRIEPLAARCAVQPLAALATMPSLAFVYLFSGEQVSAGRAAAMTCLALGVTVLCRRPDLPNLVACAGLAMLAFDPLLLFSVAFQLSFAAVTGLVLAAPRLSAPLPPGESPPPVVRLLLWCRGMFLASLVASAGTLPLAAYHFQRVSLAGPAVNVAAVPLAGFAVLPLGWGSLLVSSVWPAAGERLADLATLVCGVLIRLARSVSPHFWSSLAVPRPPPLLVVTLLVLTFLLLDRREGRPGRAATVTAAGASLFVLLWWVGSLHRPEIHAVFLDVGQGEGTLIRLPGGESLLVDTGPSWRRGDAGRRIVLPALRKMGLTRLDYLVISHFHPDHSGGLVSLLAEMKVGEIWTAPFEEEDLPPHLAALLRRWVNGGGRLRLLARGDAWTGRGGSRIDVLSPPPPAALPPSRRASVNDGSLVFLLRWKETALLMTGDAGGRPLREAARLLPEHGQDTVLKVPHHGGRQEGTGELVRAFAPRYAIISVGRNAYGHPSPETIAACGRSATVLRTDREGAVFLRGTGRSLSLRTWRGMTDGRRWTERVRWLFEGR